MKISKSHYDCLHQRRLWLTNRIEAKEKTGLETQYDVSERDALTAALAVLEVNPAPKYPPVPEGWRELESDEVIQEGDQYPYCGIGDWTPVLADVGLRQSEFYYPHIRRIPTYRPFASAEEFDAHAHRIVVNIGTGTRRRVDHYSDKGCMGMSWEMAHRKWRFLDDGSPFGVEVKP